jgi:hypothetical protein
LGSAFHLEALFCLIKLFVAFRTLDWRLFRDKYPMAPKQKKDAGASAEQY